MLNIVPLAELDAHGTIHDAAGLAARFAGDPRVAGVNTRGTEFVAIAITPGTDSAALASSVRATRSASSNLEAVVARGAAATTPLRPLIAAAHAAIADLKRRRGES